MDYIRITVSIIILAVVIIIVWYRWQKVGDLSNEMRGQRLQGSWKNDSTLVFSIDDHEVSYCQRGYAEYCIWIGTRYTEVNRPIMLVRNRLSFVYKIYNPKYREVKPPPPIKEEGYKCFTLLTDDEVLSIINDTRIQQCIFELSKLGAHKVIIGEESVEYNRDVEMMSRWEKQENLRAIGRELLNLYNAVLESKH